MPQCSRYSFRAVFGETFDSSEVWKAPDAINQAERPSLFSVLYSKRLININSIWFRLAHLITFQTPSACCDRSESARRS